MSCLPENRNVVVRLAFATIPIEQSEMSCGQWCTCADLLSFLVKRTSERKKVSALSYERLEARLSARGARKRPARRHLVGRPLTNRFAAIASDLYRRVCFDRTLGSSRQAGAVIDLGERAEQILPSLLRIAKPR